MNSSVGTRLHKKTLFGEIHGLLGLTGSWFTPPPRTSSKKIVLWSHYLVVFFQTLQSRNIHGRG